MAKDKAAKQAAKAEQQQLKSAQRAELKALKSVGASKLDIKSEQKANKVELKSLLQAQKSGTYTPRTDLTSVLSGADTYANAAYASQVQSLLGSAAQNYTDFNIPTVTKSGNTTFGVGLDKLVDYELGKTGSNFNKFMDRAQMYVGKTYTADDLTAQGVKLKQDKNNPGLFKWSTGGDTKNINYFTQNPDGTYTGVGVNRSVTQADGGFFDSALGKIALAVGSYYLGPYVSQLAGFGGGALSSAIGGGLVGGTANVLGGGKFGAGALTGAVSGFAGGGGFEGLLGTGQTVAPIDVYDPVTGQLVSTGGTNAATSAATSAATQGASNIGSVLSDAGFAASDVEQLVRNFGSTAAEQNLIAAGVDPVYAASMVDQAVMGANANQIATSISNFAGANPIFTGGASVAPITDLGFRFDENAYNQTSGLGGALRGVGNLAGAGLETITSLFGGGGFNPFGGGFGNIASLLNSPTVTPEQSAAGGFAGASPDYNALLAALSAPRAQPRSLV